ncbi:MAG: zinc ribbon domain-containing protein [Thiotrichaceae bacterium]|nr:zinc ribbon domain-containing protein [Thiotrichaceae bacterium]
MSHENYYILLDLPHTEHNTSVIENAIKKKQSDWSMLRNHPTKGQSAQKNLSLLADIRTVMQDTDLRKKEAEAAKKINTQQGAEKFKDVDESIKILSTKKYLLEEEFQRLCKQYPSIPASELRKRIKVPINKAETESKDTIQPLDKTIMKTINDNLKTLDKDSLYDFLELSPNSSLKTLLDKAAQKDAEIRKISHKTADITATGALIGHCQTIFKTQDTQKSYNLARAQAKLSELDKQINLSGTSGQIHAATYDALVKKAVSFGLSKTEANRYILDFCKNKHWAVETTTKLSVDEMMQCGYCGYLNSHHAKHCEQCGNELHIYCPKCSTKNIASVKACKKCGFFIGDMANATSLIRQARQALANQSLENAERLLKQAEIYYPNHSEINTLLQQIQTEKQKAQDKKDEIKKIVTSLNQAVNGRRFYTARTILTTLRQEDAKHPELTRQQHLIEQKIQAAEQCLYKAKSITQSDERLEAYISALSEALDCQEALDEMAKIPPEPPKNAGAIAGFQDISLSWTASSSKGEISYRVIRKLGTPPLGANDGETIGETAQMNMTDSKTEIGEEYCYAVYTLRGGSLSRLASTTDTVMRITNLPEQNITIMPADQSIQMNWQVPPKTYDIEVWAKQGCVPMQRGDGRKLNNVRREGFIDNNLQNDVTYGYLIFLIFQDSKGNKIYSHGVKKQVQPTEPPQPITTLTLIKHSRHIDVQWQTPIKGYVQLFSADTKPTYDTGDSIAIKTLSDLGQSIPIQRAGRSKLSIDFQGVVYLTPVTIQNSLAIVGTCKSVTSIDGVQNLQGSIRYQQLYLEWNWPSGAKKAVVAYRHDTYPKSATDDNATIYIIGLQEYKAKGEAFVIKQAQTQQYYFSVFIIADNTKNTLYSEAQHCLINNAGSQEIYYEIRLHKRWFGLGKVYKAVLLLTALDKSVDIPSLILVKKANNLPLRRTDGQIIYTIKKNTVAIFNHKLSIDLSADIITKKYYAKLFFEHDEDAEKYRLIPSAHEKLRIG